MEKEARNRIQGLLDEGRWTIREFAERSGINRNKILRWLDPHWSTTPTWADLLKIHEVTGVDLHWLITGKFTEHSGDRSKAYDMSTIIRDLSVMSVTDLIEKYCSSAHKDDILDQAPTQTQVRTRTRTRTTRVGENVTEFNRLVSQAIIDYGGAENLSKAMMEGQAISPARIEELGRDGTPTNLEITSFTLILSMGFEELREKTVHRNGVSG